MNIKIKMRTEHRAQGLLCLVALAAVFSGVSAQGRQNIRDQIGSLRNRGNQQGGTGGTATTPPAPGGGGFQGGGGGAGGRGARGVGARAGPNRQRPGFLGANNQQQESDPPQAQGRLLLQKEVQ
ncbi:hypothetical protein BSKO_02461 [Bryopsis sp. KO-2023]|nr:hypothetical protein BSKO_02461 [Bryopsis sp. KO-2023]